MCHLKKALDLSLSFQSDHLCTKDKKGPRMDLWGTPALGSVHDECW